jgi:hypothetical protein
MKGSSIDKADLESKGSDRFGSKPDLSFLAGVLGSDVAANVMVFLVVNSEGYATQISNHLQLAVSGVHAQLVRFEGLGILSSRSLGKSRFYTFSPRGKNSAAFKKYLQTVVKNLNLEEQIVFAVRSRPRSLGKEVSYNREPKTLSKL